MRRTDEGWALRIRDASEENVPVVVLAMGGLSFPAVGTDGTGYAIARRDLNHVLNEPYPALVPLTGAHPGGEMMPGVSVDVSLECETVAVGDEKSKKKKKKSKASREGFLFTHRGYSGPSVLDLSHNVVRPARAFGARGRRVREGRREERRRHDAAPVARRELVGGE